MTAEIIRSVIDSHISSLGGVASNTIVAPGKEGADPHNTGSGPVFAHQPIIIDIFPRVTAHGYHGDLTRTVVKGKASPTVKKAYAAVKKARNLAKKMLKPGISGATVHGQVQKTLEDAGFKTDADAAVPYGFFHTTGHGLGLDVHEYPRISSTDIRYRSGYVLTVEPGLYYPDWGGVRLEDVIVIEKGGCRCLTSVPDILEIP